MTDLKDTIQVGLANGSAIGFSITDCNEILTLVSLVLAIGFTIYKLKRIDDMDVPTNKKHKLNNKNPNTLKKLKTKLRLKKVDKRSKRS